MLFTATSLVISKHMIAPLVDFVSLLRNLGHMMAGQHESGSSDAARMEQLSSFIQNRRDEIGEVAHAIKDMLINMQSISFFRKTIEADESTKEIYERLARIFIERLGLNQFVIYEKLRGHTSMEHVFSYPPELKDDLPEFAMANNCRAKRTGSIITSYDDQHICNIFPFQDCLDHYCVPMIVGGHVIGVVQFLFQMEFNPGDLDQALTDFWIDEEKKPVEHNRVYVDEMVRGVLEKRRELDRTLTKCTQNWDVERLGVLDRTVMRVAVYEMLYRSDIPPAVSINEAVEIAKAYSSKESGRFVNGVLDRIQKGLDRPLRSPDVDHG